MGNELYKALSAEDFQRAEELLRAGADINSLDNEGESLLCDIILQPQTDADRLLVVSFMLKHGADPKLVSPDGGGPLFSAVIAQDNEVLRLLLDHGADPNHEHVEGESLYDWAECDYRFEIFNINKFPEEPTVADRASEDAWLQFLDRIATKHCKRRPDYLLLLRERGALTRVEQVMRGGQR